MPVVRAQENPTNPRWARFTPDNSGLADLRITDVVEALDGSMWFAQHVAVSRFDGRAWHTFPATINLPEDASVTPDDPLAPPWEAFGLVPLPINRAIEDSRGALWFATDAGVFRLAPDTWENGIPAYRGMASYQVRDVLRDSYGVLWFAAYDPISGEGSLSGLGPSGQWLFFNAEVDPGLVSNQIVALAEDKYGGLWAGSASSGVSRFLGSNWRSWTAADSPLPDDRIIDLQRGPDGNVVVVTPGGIVHYDLDADAWEAWVDGLRDGAEVRASLVAADGTDWFFIGGQLFGLGVDGLTRLDIEIDSPVVSIAERVRDGSLWAAGEDSLLRWRAGDRGVAEIDLPLSDARHLAVDSHGALWVSTVEGLVRYDPDTGRVALFNAEISGLAENSARLLTEDNGLLVFGTDRVFVSTYRPQPPARPTLTLSVDGEPAMPVSARPIILPLGAQQVTFYISTAAWWPAEALAYHTRLDGVLGVQRGDNPTAHQIVVTLELADLGAGEHTFCVYASNPMLDTSPEACAAFIVP